MNDKELDGLLNELADHYEDEFDLEGGLARLRAAGHGFPRREAVEDETHVGTTGGIRRRPMSSLAAKADVDTEIALLEGVLVSDDVVQIDLTKLEGAPSSQHALVRLDRRPTSEGDLGAYVIPCQPRTLRDVITSPLGLPTIAGAFASLMVTVIALTLDAGGFVGFTAAVATMVTVMYRGSQLMIRQPKKMQRQSSRKGT